MPYTRKTTHGVELRRAAPCVDLRCCDALRCERGLSPLQQLKPKTADLLLDTPYVPTTTTEWGRRMRE